MKKIFISIALIAASLFNINGQSKLSENTTLAIACETPIGIDNQNAITIIENNIKQALVLNGLSATESRFTTITSAVLINKDVTATAPAKYINIMEVSIFIADLYTGVIFGQTSFEIKGVGDSDGEAYIDAIHKINARNPKLRKLIKGAKESIIEYFESHSEEILGRIDSYMKAKDYKSAAYEAYAIPMVCKDLYNQASERIAYIPAEVLSGINPNAENIAKHFYSEPRGERICNVINK